MGERVSSLDTLKRTPRTKDRVLIDVYVDDMFITTWTSWEGLLQSLYLLPDASGVAIEALEQSRWMIRGHYDRHIQGYVFELRID